MLTTIFKFLIDNFITMVNWFYNLPISLSENISIPLGSLILSFFALGLIILVFRSYFGFSKKE